MHLLFPNLPHVSVPVTKLIHQLFNFSVKSLQSPAKIPSLLYLYQNTTNGDALMEAFSKRKVLIDTKHGLPMHLVFLTLTLRMFFEVWNAFFIGKNTYWFVKRWQKEIRMNTRMLHYSWIAYWQHLMQGSLWSTHSCHALSVLFSIAPKSLVSFPDICSYLSKQSSQIFHFVLATLYISAPYSMFSLSHCFIILS